MARLYVVTVLFDPDEAAVNRMLRSVGVAVERALTEAVVTAGGVLVGDCSPEPLASAPRLAGLEVRYWHFDENLGHSAGCNELVSRVGKLAAADDVVVFLNPDTVVAPDALAKLAAAVSAPSVGVADARQIPFEHPKAFDPETGEESWASGACMALRAGVFHEVGGFDSKYFWSYCNDVDISWRIRAKGYSAVYVPEAVVFHDKRMDSDGGLIATSTQDFYSTLGRLHLAHRYGRPDLAAETAKWIRRSGGAEHRRALAVYEAEKARQDLPSRIAGADRVAQFVGQEYAVHRF